MLLLLLGWLAYYTLHSVLAATSVKAAVAARWPRVTRYYRLAYNVLAAVLLAGLLFYQQQRPATALWEQRSGLLITGYALLLGGTGLGLLALRGYNLAEFGGWGYLRPGDLPVSTDLNTSGLNARMRHPLYTGLLLALAGYLLVAPTLPHLISVACSAIYVLVGVRLEERKLRQHFGQAYTHYQTRVPMLLPRLRKQ